MNIQYPVSEILQCVDHINDPEKEIYENSNEVLVLHDSLKMEEKKKETEETKEIENISSQSIQIEETTKLDNLEINKTETKDEIKELESTSLQPFQIEEITKIEDSEVSKKEATEDVLVLTEQVPSEYSTEKNVKKQDSQEIKKLNEQVSILKKHNAMLEHDLNEVFKTINHKTAEKELQSRLELVYEQQKVIKDYENQISYLKEQNQFLEQKFDSPPTKIITEVRNDHIAKIDEAESSQPISQEKYVEEIKIKSKIIHEQQSILADYQDKVSKLKEENQLLQKSIEINNSKLIAATQIQTEDSEKNSKMEDMIGKIKFYQEDNLRLSNEVGKLTNKLENAKQQLNQFENNKAKLTSQLQNLNSIVSENNVIGSPFGSTKPKIEDKSEKDEKISNEKQVNFGNIKNPEEINRLTKEIFKKSSS